MTNESGVYDSDWLGFDWSPWLSLHPDDEEVESLTTDAGVYRVRHEVYDGLVYIGETGRSLRGRIYALRRGIYDSKMPFSDPHTASPSLWAIVDRHGPGFEVSAAAPPRAEGKQQRKAIEDALIALHRRETETNLVGNFGRMPPGYSKSKSRSTGVRGSRSEDDTLRSFRESADPLGWENPSGITDSEWMGLSWSPAQLLEDAPGDAPDTGGVYRLWDDEVSPPLEYVGESVSLRNRLSSHRRDRDRDLLFSYAALSGVDEKHQLSQVETGLLGAHWLACGEAPSNQY